ncbi:MAG TPA: response regulator [Bryobacteraceae bacterium]|jgi:CheY-like chemotaxis protein
MSCTAPSGTIRVLIVEDNPVDLYFIQEALRAGEMHHEQIAVDDGEPALRLLRQEAPYQNEPPPDLVILDLNLRRVDGREVLSYIRGSRALRETPVAIVSSSPADVVHAEELGADCYIRKPSNLEAFLGIGKTIWDCYLEKGERG